MHGTFVHFSIFANISCIKKKKKEKYLSDKYRTNHRCCMRTQLSALSILIHGTPHTSQTRKYLDVEGCRMNESMRQFCAISCNFHAVANDCIWPTSRKQSTFHSCLLLGRDSRC